MKTNKILSLLLAILFIASGVAIASWEGGTQGKNGNGDAERNEAIGEAILVSGTPSEVGGAKKYQIDYKDPEGKISVSASSAILMDADTGSVIFSKNAEKELPMASTTKIMTAITVLENAELDKIVKVSPIAVGTEGSSVYLYAGEELSIEQLLYALMLQSANDAAVALAVEVGGSIEGFAELMNEKARELGLEHTHFENPHGLDHKEHYTSARDLAIISAYALKNPDFKRICSTYRTVIPMQNGEGSRLLINHNRMLKFYDGAIGVKTGYTKRSGRCLVSAAERDGVMLIAVTLDAPDDWRDHRAMLDTGFSLCESVTLSAEGEISGDVALVGGQSETFRYSCPEVKLTLPKGERHIKRVIELPRFCYAPIEKGKVVGRALWYLDGKLIASSEICAEQSVGQITEKLSLWDKIVLFFENLF